MTEVRCFAWSVFVDGLALQQCQFTDTYIAIFTLSMFGNDVTGFKSPCDAKWLLSSRVS